MAIEPIFRSPRWRHDARKLAVLAGFTFAVLPMLLLNIGSSFRDAGRPDPTLPVAKYFPTVDGLILRQRWSLFTYIPPFNFATVFEAELNDGSIAFLEDGYRQKATGWQGWLYYNELKIQSNLYSNPMSLRRYAEYLLRKKGIDPQTVKRRIISIDYQMLNSRAEAAEQGSLYGVSGRMELDAY